jgi:hypothetical protein
VPPTPQACTPPMVRQDPNDPNSPCVKPEDPSPIDPIIPIIMPEECNPPMVRQDPNDPNSPCIFLPLPNPEKCSNPEIEYRPSIHYVNSTIFDIDKKLCSHKELILGSKIEIRGFIKNNTNNLSNSEMSRMDIKFFNLETLGIYKPTLIDNIYVIQITKGKYRIQINAPNYSRFKYEVNLDSSSCEDRIENTIVLLPPTPSGVEITLNPVIPVPIGDNVKICNTTDYFSNESDKIKHTKLINLRGELIREVNKINDKLKLDTNNMNDDVIIYISGIHDLLKNGHTKLHILTDDGNQHCIDIPSNMDSKNNVVVGHIDKDSKQFKKNE